MAISQKEVTVTFIRHAQTENNRRADTIGGHSTLLPINETGEHQAICIGKYLKDNSYKFSSYYCSVARRAQDTFALCFPDVKSYNLEEKLLEQDQGDWEGKPKSKYQEERVKRDLEQNNWTSVPGDKRKGESKEQTADRLYSWLELVLNNAKNGDSVVAVSHGSAIKFLLAKLFSQINKDTAYKDIKVNNASITEVKFKNGYAVSCTIRNPIEESVEEQKFVNKEKKFVVKL